MALKTCSMYITKSSLHEINVHCSSYTKTHHKKCSVNMLKIQEKNQPSECKNKKENLKINQNRKKIKHNK